MNISQSLFDQVFMRMVQQAHSKFTMFQEPSVLFDTMQTISQIAVQVNTAVKSQTQTVFSSEKVTLLQHAFDDLLFDINRTLRFTHDENIAKDLYANIHVIEQAFKTMKESIIVV